MSDFWLNVLYTCAALMVSALVAWIIFLKRKVKNLTKELTATSYVDSCTTAYNYRYFIERLRQSVDQARRKEIDISVLKVDIEHFKNINAIYGDAQGDAVLKEFALFLKETTRSSDVIFRLDADSFAVLLNVTSKHQALFLAKRFKEKLQFHSFGIDTRPIALDVSIAVVTAPQDGISDISILTFLDKCLEKSKETGGKVTTPADLNHRSNRFLTLPYHNVAELTNKMVDLEAIIGKTVLESIIAFANAIKAKDLYTAQHTSQTVAIALSLAKGLDLNAKQLDIVRYAALLHDLGKVGVPERILTKPGKLTNEEFEQIKRHPVIGVEILRPLRELTEIIPPILYHHERHDGMGYPYGLCSGSIPIEAKIVSVADAFQALVSNRVYRTAYSVKEALAIIEREAGTHFDPAIIAVFKKMISYIKLHI